MEVKISGLGIDISELRQEILKTKAGIDPKYGVSCQIENRTVDADGADHYRSTVSSSSEIVMWISSTGAVAALSRVLIAYIRSRQTKLKIRANGKFIEIDSKLGSLDDIAKIVEQVLQDAPSKVVDPKNDSEPDSIGEAG